MQITSSKLILRRQLLGFSYRQRVPPCLSDLIEPLDINAETPSSVVFVCVKPLFEFFLDVVCLVVIGKQGLGVVSVIVVLVVSLLYSLVSELR